jgi:outer membrane protein insertion porin family
MEKFGYKSNKTGIDIGTNFEYLDDFRLGLGMSNFYEVIKTDSTASEAQQKQKGNYWDSFLNLDFNYDKRNQKFQTIIRIQILLFFGFTSHKRKQYFEKFLQLCSLL